MTYLAPMIAALFVHRHGVYFGLDGVDPWDESRDARQYPGPHHDAEAKLALAEGVFRTQAQLLREGVIRT